MQPSPSESKVRLLSTIHRSLILFIYKHEVPKGENFKNLGAESLNLPRVTLEHSVLFCLMV